MKCGYGNYTTLNMHMFYWVYIIQIMIVIIIYSGPEHPMMPVLDGIGNISDSSALIQWTVSSIAYTPETYVVEYGTSQDSLDMTSDPTHSGEDITVVNQMYSVTLTDLREKTTYYVHIVANNTAGRSTTSSVERFTTSLAELGIAFL